MMRDFLTFRKMLTPILIQIIFWLGIVACVASAIHVVLQKQSIWLALETVFFGPIIVRIVCEFFILFFRINETLTDIRNSILSK